MSQGLDALRAGFDGTLIEPGDDGYDDARRVWNGMIDQRPAVIASCASTGDVVAAVNHARTHGLEIAVRGGGHNVAGNATCEGGIVIDLGPINQVAVDADHRVARAGGGTTWKEYDAATQAHGLASPGGAISSTGIAGLTLGGGFGWLSRAHGLACDNLIGAEVVTADGRVLNAGTDEHADLFWGLRGGGGNFGVVTRFDFSLQPVGELLAGFILYPRSEAGRFLATFAEVTASAPEQLSSMAALLCAPDGTPVAGAFVAYHGPIDQGERVLAPLRSLGTPVLDDVAPKPYTAVQQSLDDGFPRGMRNYWKSGFVAEVGDALFDVLIDHARRAPSPVCVVGLEHMGGGAVGRVGADETAFACREFDYNLLILGRCEHAEDDDRLREWVRGLYDATRPHSAGTVYVNYMDQDEADRIGQAYDAERYTRLVELKRKYDPENLFRRNQNIAP